MFDPPITWREISKRTFKEMVADDCLGLAAQLAYYLGLDMAAAQALEQQTAAKIDAQPES